MLFPVNENDREFPIFSMLGVLFSRWVFIHLSLHERVARNRDAQSHNEIKNNNNKIPWNVLVWRAPVDTTSHGLWNNGGKEMNFTFYLGTAYDVSSKENIGNSRSFSLTGKACLSKYFISLISALSSSTFDKYLLPSVKGLSIYFYAIFIFTWVSIFSYKAPTREHYFHTCALCVANIWVCFMNGSMIEHNGLGITFFSVDILKDMVAC